MKISIIVAVANNNVIGSRNSLPWYLPADLKHFKKVTLGHHILMGQKTFESIGKPLPGRTTIILSDDPSYKKEDCIVVNTPEKAIETAKKKGEKELMICGGGQVYKTFLPMADRMYLTKVKAKIDGDIYFPAYNEDEWKIVSKETYTADEKNIFPYEFLIYEKI